MKNRTLLHADLGKMSQGFQENKEIVVSNSEPYSEVKSQSALCYKIILLHVRLQ